VVFEQRVVLRMHAQKNMHLKEIKLQAHLKILGLIVDITEGGLHNYLVITKIFTL
jgi:hypothetical protein